jgi:hypothetical protein
MEYLVTKQSFRHNLKWVSNQNLLHLIFLCIKCNKKTKLHCHFSTKQSFRHNLNQASNQKTSLKKVVPFRILMDKMY